MISASAVVRAALLCAAALSALACQGGGDAPGGDTPAARAGETLTAAAPTCGVDAATPLTGDGIGDLRVGATVDAVARSCRIVRDTIAPGPEGMAERTILVDLGRDSVTAVVESARVWRVHVRRPALRTADSLGVGTPVSALRRPGARVLTGEGVFLTLPGHCGLSFRLRGVAPGAASTPAQVPDSAIVSEVLAFGC